MLQERVIIFKETIQLISFKMINITYKMNHDTFSWGQVIVEGLITYTI
jgi:hypothetical protein